VHENFDMEKLFPEQKSLVQDRLITSKKLPLKEHIESVYKNTKTIKSLENVLGEFDLLNVNYSAPSVRQYKRLLSLRDRFKITLETIQPYCFENNYSQKVPVCLEQFPLTESGCLPLPV